MVSTQGGSPWGLRLCVLFGLFIVYTTAQDQNAQNTQFATSCCLAKLLDAPGYVLMEANAELSTGTEFTGLITKVCTTSTVHVQIWREKTDSSNQKSYEFRWEQIITPTLGDITSTNPAIYALDTPVTFTDDDRLAIFSKESDTVPIPFEFNADNDDYAFFLSNGRFPADYDFSTADLTLEALRWPRSFRPYIYFCTSNACEQGTRIPSSPGLQTPFISGPPGVQGPPGAAGPPGPPGVPGTFNGNDFIGSDGTFYCNVPDVASKVSESTEKITDLEEKLQTMKQTLDSISNSNTVTGICPINTMSGVYGLGSCYVIQLETLPMGVAEIKCQEIFGGHLVRIETEREGNFLLNQVLNNGEIEGVSVDSTVKFWTAGMYAQSIGWFWYHEPKIRERIQYSNWKNGIAPMPVRSSDVCLTLNIQLRDTTSDWWLANCSGTHPYICEIPKKCL